MSIFDMYMFEMLDMYFVAHVAKYALHMKFLCENDTFSKRVNLLAHDC